ncbi:hypothetical protein BGX27_003013 [Mortierella sp. AM989]|nr:hypothetical protein BGX27_003013 [Mortierella sp. AM989]
MPENPSHLRWALDKQPDKEHVYFSNFVRHFTLTDRESATQAFISLINSTSIRKARQDDIRQAFEDFQKHYEKQFWIDRDDQVKSQQTAKIAGGIIQDAGIKQAQISLDQYFESLVPATSSADVTEVSESQIEGAPPASATKTFASLISSNTSVVASAIDPQQAILNLQLQFGHQHYPLSKALDDESLNANDDMKATSCKNLPPMGTFSTSKDVLERETGLKPSLSTTTSSTSGATAPIIPMSQQANEEHTVVGEEIPGDEIENMGSGFNSQFLSNKFKSTKKRCKRGGLG